MKKIVLRLDLHDEKAKQNAFHAVTTFRGIDKIAVDKEKRKLKVVGTVDPVDVVNKLRELGLYTVLLLFGSAKEPKKKEKAKEEPKKVEPKKEKPKKEEPKKEKPKKEEPKKVFSK